MTSSRRFALCLLVMTLGACSAEPVAMSDRGVGAALAGDPPSVRIHNRFTTALIAQGRSAVVRRNGQPLSIAAGGAEWDTLVPAGRRTYRISDGTEPARTLGSFEIELADDAQMFLWTSPRPNGSVRVFYTSAAGLVESPSLDGAADPGVELSNEAYPGEAGAWERVVVSNGGVEPLYATIDGAPAGGALLGGRTSLTFTVSGTHVLRLTRDGGAVVWEGSIHPSAAFIYEDPGYGSFLVWPGVPGVEGRATSFQVLRTRFGGVFQEVPARIDDVAAEQEPSEDVAVEVGGIQPEDFGPLDLGETPPTDQGAAAPAADDGCPGWGDESDAGVYCCDADTTYEPYGCFEGYFECYEGSWHCVVDGYDYGAYCDC